MPPVIYLVDGSVARTGAFVCARNIARALAGQVRVVLVLPRASKIPDPEVIDFAAVQRLPIISLRRSAWSVLAYVPALVAASIALRWRMGRDQACALIVNDFYLMHGALCRLMGFRGRVITWVRMDPAAFGARLSRLWLRMAVASSDRLVAVSRHIRGQLPHGMPADLIYDTLDPLPKRAPFYDRGSVRFVYIGNYIPGKGQDHAIEAFAALSGGRPDTTLDFFGGDMGLPKNRAFLETLAARVATLGLQDRIRLHGFAADPGAARSGALAALNFSASESFSMTVLEASGAGLPVITTRSGGPVEIIEDGVTGFVVPVGDVAAMTAAMRAIIDDPFRAQAMGAAGRARVAQMFSAKSFRDGLMALLALDEPSGTQSAP